MLRMMQQAGLEEDAVLCRSRAALTYAEAQSRLDDPRLHDEVSDQTVAKSPHVPRQHRAPSLAAIIHMCGLAAANHEPDCRLVS